MLIREEPQLGWDNRRMAKWLCPCGNQIRSSGAIPNPQELHVISDADLHELPEIATFDDVLRLSQYVYRCNVCDRLHIFWDDLHEWPPAIYTLESRGDQGRHR